MRTLIGIAILVFLGLNVLSGAKAASTTYTTYEAQHAVDAAEVGDKVEPKSLSVMCSNEDDAWKVLKADTLATAMYVYRGTWDAIKSGHATRQAAIRSAHSCRVIDGNYSGAPMLVEQKQIGGEGMVKYVSYTLRNDQGLWFVKVQQNDLSPFKPVKRPKAVETK